MGLRTTIQSALLHHDIAMVLENVFMKLPLVCSLELKFPKKLGYGNKIKEKWDVIVYVFDC